MGFTKFKDKKILFLSVQTFNYEKAIAYKLRSFGAKVDYYDERPANTILVKGIIRFKRSLYQKKINSYYNKILKKTTDIKYDYLFVIKGEVVPNFFLEELKKRIPYCQFIFYTWDSFDNNPNAISILHFFDKKFTFDSNDAINYKLNFRPLFFIDEYKKIRKEDAISNIYSVLFLGTAHTDRYKISNKVMNWCTEKGLTSYAYYFMQSRLVFLFKSLFDSSFKGFEYKKMNFSTLTINQIIDLYDKSFVILDINHPGQRGLTMRTFETMGAEKKIITTNAEIKKYLFYNPNNIFIIDRNNIVLETSFFETNYEPLSEELYKRASIEGWLNCIFLEKESSYWIKGID